MGKTNDSFDAVGGFKVNGTEVINSSGQVTGNIKDALAEGKIYIGQADGLSDEKAISGDIALTALGETSINDNVVDSAALAHGTDAQMYVCAADGTPTLVSISGDLSISNTGVATVSGTGTFNGASSVGYADITGTTSDGETVTITDGGAISEVYEFDTDASFSGIQVDISGGNSATQSATALVSAINANSTIVSAFTAGDGTVHIMSRIADDNNYTLADTATNIVVSAATTDAGNLANAAMKVYGGKRTITAQDVTTTTDTGGTILLGAVPTSQNPLTTQLFVRDSSFLLKALASSAINWVQIDTNYYGLLLSETQAAATELTAGDIIEWSCIA